MAVRSQTVVDQEASGVEWSSDRPICPVCREGQFLKRWKRVVIERATWTGENIFYAPGMPGTIFVSERFKEVCETMGVRNAAFIPAEEQSREWCPWEIPDWEVRQFDETMSVLHSWNKLGRFDHFIDAMLEVRERVVGDQTFKWIEELRERFGKIDAVGDAAAEAHYKLVGMPRPGRR